MPSISRDVVVRALTVVLTPLVGGLVAWLAKYQINLPNATVLALAITASVAVLGLAFHWLMKQPIVLKAEADVEAVAKRIAVEVDANPDLKNEVHALRGDLMSQMGALIDAVGKATGMSAGTLAMLKQAISALEGNQTPAEPSVVQGGFQAQPYVTVSGGTLDTPAAASPSPEPAPATLTAVPEPPQQ